MNDEFEFNLEQVYITSSRLSYKDNEGLVEVHLEKSTVTDFDWIGAEPDFEVNRDRLEMILNRLVDWSRSKGLTIKILTEDELGFEYPPLELNKPS